MNKPSGKYTIFVYHEHGKKSLGGGLGDRLAGLVTAFAYSIRTNRTFLIQGDPAFEDSFQPFGTPPNKYTWKSWDWAKWDRSYSQNMAKLDCVNPRPSMKHCSLDIDYHINTTVVKYYGNRVYLCRWLVKPSLGLRDHIAETLNLVDTTDIYQMAGCLLRMAMWPTETLWDALDQSLASQASSLQTSAEITKQIGFHFRCGDSSFAQKDKSVKNPECWYDLTQKIPWKGTGFSDDQSMDSPIDAASCGRQILEEAAAKAGRGPSSALAYIASDNQDSSQQINSTLQWPLTIRPPEACHVDLAQNKHCGLMTILHWFMLSLSDAIVMQALIKPPSGPYANSKETQNLPSDEPAPISAFSRYAAIYSLSPNVIRFGRGCKTANTMALSRLTHGNWVCDPKQFY